MICSVAIDCMKNSHVPSEALFFISGHQHHSRWGNFSGCGPGKRRQLFRSDIIKGKGMSLNPQNQAKTLSLCFVIWVIHGSGWGFIWFSFLCSSAERDAKSHCSSSRVEFSIYWETGLTIDCAFHFLFHDFIYKFRDSGIQKSKMIGSNSRILS